jgi:hypothetical protein
VSRTSARAPSTPDTLHESSTLSLLPPPHTSIDQGDTIMADEPQTTVLRRVYKHVAEGSWYPLPSSATFAEQFKEWQIHHRTFRAGTRLPTNDTEGYLLWQEWRTTGGVPAVALAYIFADDQRLAGLEGHAGHSEPERRVERQNIPSHRDHDRKHEHTPSDRPSFRMPFAAASVTRADPENTEVQAEAHRSQSRSRSPSHDARATSPQAIGIDSTSLPSSPQAGHGHPHRSQKRGANAGQSSLQTHQPGSPAHDVHST